MKKAAMVILLVSICFMLSGCIIIGGNPEENYLAMETSSQN
jgi:starvation-inducible outer membrane lipoprotein